MPAPRVPDDGSFPSILPGRIPGCDGIVVNSVQYCIDEFDGYISYNTDIYSLSFMVTTGPACVVSMVAFAKMFYPDAAAFADFDADEAFAEYLEMAGWDERTDISDIIMYGPGNTTTATS